MRITQVHLTVAIFYEQGRDNGHNRYTIWRVDQVGRPRGVWTLEETWNEVLVDKYQAGWSLPRPRTYQLQTEAVKEARRAAKVSNLGVDIEYRSFSDLYGPNHNCAICSKELASRGWEPSICTDCRVTYQHGALARGEKEAYMIGPHPGNGRTKERERIHYPLPDLLAALVGSVVRAKRHTPGERFGSAPIPEKAAGTVGYKDPRSYWGGDMMVDLTPDQSTAWSALVEWVKAQIDDTEREALDQGTRLLTGLATGTLSPEDFDPQIMRLRNGRRLNR